MARETIHYNEEAASAPDFSFFVTDPVIPYDLLLTDGTESWSFHKSVLRKISPVFADILDGDQDLEEISIGENLTVQSMDIFQKFVYTKPSQREALLRDSQLELAFEIHGAGTEEVNGLYIAGGARDGVTKYVRFANGKSYELTRGKNEGDKTRWFIVSLPIGSTTFYYCDTQGDKPPESKWKGLLGYKPAPRVISKQMPKANYPIKTADMISLHTILSKYDLKLPHLTDYLKWIYAHHWSPNVDSFVAVTTDAQQKGLAELAGIASATQIKYIDGSTVAAYPKNFQKMILQTHADHADFAMMVAAISKKAISDNDDSTLALVQEAVANKSAKFKAEVFDLQLRANKRRCIG